MNLELFAKGSTIIYASFSAGAAIATASDVLTHKWVKVPLDCVFLASSIVFTNLFFVYWKSIKK